MLFEAFFWNPEIPRPALDDFFRSGEIKKLLKNWGRTGDRAVVAEIDGSLVGAAWFRLWTESDHSYGFIHHDIPELGMAIVGEYRSRGYGRRLLKKLIDLANEDGYVALSLSVDPANFAQKLYESEGFAKVGESGTSWTYKLEW
jgi:ribosomal-protein-alanine N-acetyltransferase